MTLEEMYAMIPETKRCIGSGDCCCTSILISVEEMARIPAIQPGYRVWENRCIHLGADLRCRIYDVRPFVCRLYGAGGEFACPHGAKPDTLLSDNEVESLMELYYRNFIGEMELHLN